jgi:hypothetical protein
MTVARGIPEVTPGGHGFMPGLLPLEVFDQDDLRDVPLDKDAGKRKKSGVLGGPVAAFARDDDQIRAIGRHPEQDRLDDPLKPDRLGQVSQRRSGSPTGLADRGQRVSEIKSNPFSFSFR